MKRLIFSFYIFILLGCLSACGDAAKQASEKPGTGTIEESKTEPEISPEPVPSTEPDPIPDVPPNTDEQNPEPNPNPTPTPTPTPTLDTTAPRIISRTPLSDQVSVSNDSVITAEFDEELLAKTINSNSFVLLNNVNNISVPSNVSYDQTVNVATLTPLSPLAVLTQYSATLTTEIADLSGNVLEGESRWLFTTAEGAWSVAGEIETDNAGHSFNPRVAFDNDGNAIAIWEQSDGARSNIWANRFSPGDGWGFAELVEKNNSGNAFAPDIVLDAGGNAIAVWYQSNGTRTNIWANRYTRESGWGLAELVEHDDSGSASNPQLSIDKNGNVFAVWQQSDGLRSNIWANRYTSNTGWGTAELIEKDNIGDALNPQIEVDDEGNAIAVWQQTNGTNENIWANRYTFSIGWGDAAKIENIDVGSGYYPQVAAHKNGDFMVVWHQWDGGSFLNIWANRYDVNNGWGIATPIETENEGHANYAQIAIDDISGDTLAVWWQSDGIRDNIYANRFSPLSGWEKARLIETNNSGGAFNPVIVFDINGNALVVWSQWDGSKYFDIWAKRYTLDKGWEVGGKRISTGTGNAASVAQIAMDTRGNAIAVWGQSDGTRYNIWANLFD